MAFFVSFGTPYLHAPEHAPGSATASVQRYDLHNVPHSIIQAINVTTLSNSCDMGIE